MGIRYRVVRDRADYIDSIPRLGFGIGRIVRILFKISYDDGVTVILEILVSFGLRTSCTLSVSTTLSCNAENVHYCISRGFEFLNKTHSNAELNNI